MKRAFILLVVFAACRPPVITARTSIAGRAVLVSPIVGAHVRVTMIDADNREVLADSVTDEEGRFDIELVNGEGTLLVEVLGDAGGTTKEPISQKSLQLSYTDRFANLMGAVALGQRVEGIVISPWSTLVSARAEWDMENNKTPPPEALVNSAQLFLDHFAGIAFLGSEPMDPSVGPTNGLPSGAIHGFITSGLAAMGADLSRRLRLSAGNLINVLSLTQWLATDLRADGRFDGRGYEGPMAVVDDQLVDVEFTRAHLGAALGTFITSQSNLSGVALADLTALINAITSDGSILYGVPSSVAVSDGDGPKIIVTSPITNTTLRNEVIITGNITSGSGVAGAEIFLDDAQISNGNRTAVGAIEFSGSYPIADGYHVLKVTARESSGKPSSISVPFTSDATAPIIKFSFCTALDDRKRSPAPIYRANQQLTDWSTAPIAEADCNLDTLSDETKPYVFHSFSELMKEAENSTRFGFVPEEQGPVTTAQSALIVEVGVYKGDTLIGQLATLPARQTETTRAFALSSEYFGDAFRDVSIDDVLDLKMTAIDAQGNEGHFGFKFVLDVLPSPLKIVEVTPAASSIERVESYTFAAGNVAQLLDPTSPLPAGVLVARRFELTNVSDRAIAFKIPLQSGSAFSVAYSEWLGFVAGEAIANGTDATSATAPTQAELETLSIGSHWDQCGNATAQEHLRLPSLTYPMKVAAIAGGMTTCIDTNSFLSNDSVATATGTWSVRIHNAQGDLRFAGPGGDYKIEPNETLLVSIGVQKTAFEARTELACTLNYKLWEYNSGFAPRQYTDIMVATSGAPSLFAMPLGLPVATRAQTQYFPFDSFGWTYSDVGWVDCSGVSCGQQGCRTAADQFVLRVQGAQHTDDWNQSTHWLRQAKREWAELALSRYHQPHELRASGTASITSTSRLVTNKQSYDSTFNFPSETFSLSHSTTMTRNPLPQALPAIYTKGNVP